MFFFIYSLVFFHFSDFAGLCVHRSHLSWDHGGCGVHGVIGVVMFWEDSHMIVRKGFFVLMDVIFKTVVVRCSLALLLSRYRISQGLWTVRVMILVAPLVSRTGRGVGAFEWFSSLEFEGIIGG
ncbi:hypothetical protein Dimus_034869 [Dionaea muscipula]